MPRIERDIAKLKAEVAQRPLPRHVGIIMDGNGRWAEQRGLPRLDGHRRGSDSVSEVTRAARRLGLNALTLYAFSSQNWLRPPDEVSGLMDLLRDYLNRERPEIMENGIRLHAIGELDRLPPRVRDPLEALRRDSAQHTDMTLTLALSYGGREEIIAMARRIANASFNIRNARTGTRISHGMSERTPIRANSDPRAYATAASPAPPAEHSHRTQALLTIGGGALLGIALSVLIARRRRADAGGKHTVQAGD